MSIALNGDGIISGVSSITVGAGASVFSPAANTLAFGTNDSERVRIDSSGNIGIGTNSPADGSRLHIQGGGGLLVRRSAGTSIARFGNTGSVSPNITLFGSSTVNEPYIGCSTDDLIFGTSNAERARIDSSGRFLVGSSTATNNLRLDAKLAVVSIGSGGYGGINITNYGGTGEGVASFIDFNRSNGTSDGSFTSVASGNILGYLVWRGATGSQFNNFAEIRAEVDGTPGTNDAPGRLIFATTADGASSSTERMRISNNGTVLMQKTATGMANEGLEFVWGLGLGVTNNQNPVLRINRLGTDGTLVSFQQDTVEEGTISVSGTTVSYNGAHLSRWSQLINIDPHDKSQRPEILRGTVMSNLDEMCQWIDPETGEEQDNEQLNKTQISTVEDDPNVAGVFQSWDDDDDTWVNDYYLAMTGDFVIRIAADTTVSRGDLLISAGDGTAKPQGDRYLKDSTIAKVTSTHVTCTYEDGSYCVPCVLMAC